MPKDAVPWSGLPLPGHGGLQATLHTLWIPTHPTPIDLPPENLLQRLGSEQTVNKTLVYQIDWLLMGVIIHQIVTTAILGMIPHNVCLEHWTFLTLFYDLLIIAVLSGDQFLDPPPSSKKALKFSKSIGTNDPKITQFTGLGKAILFIAQVWRHTKIRIYEDPKARFSVCVWNNGWILSDSNTEKENPLSSSMPPKSHYLDSPGGTQLADARDSSPPVSGGCALNLLLRNWWPAKKKRSVVTHSNGFYLNLLWAPFHKINK